MPENSTNNAHSHHRGWASFLLSSTQKVGDYMDSYDNDELLLMLDDDLFFVESENVD